MTIYIDINTGNAQRADGSPLPPFRFFAGDLLEFNIVYVDGTSTVTSTVLANSAVQRIGIKPMGAGGSLLAGVTGCTVAGSTATAVLPLTDSTLSVFLQNNVPTGQRSAQMLFEVEIAAADDSTRQTYHQSVVTVFKEVIAAGDADPGQTGNLFDSLVGLFDDLVGPFDSL